MSDEDKPSKEDLALFYQIEKSIKSNMDKIVNKYLTQDSKVITVAEYEIIMNAIIIVNASLVGKLISASIKSQSTKEAAELASSQFEMVLNKEIELNKKENNNEQ